MYLTGLCHGHQIPPSHHYRQRVPGEEREERRRGEGDKREEEEMESKEEEEVEEASLLHWSEGGVADFTDVTVELGRQGHLGTHFLHF